MFPVLLHKVASDTHACPFNHLHIWLSSSLAGRCQSDLFPPEYARAIPAAESAVTALIASEFLYPDPIPVPLAPGT